MQRLDTQMKEKKFAWNQQLNLLKIIMKKLLLLLQTLRWKCRCGRYTLT